MSPDGEKGRVATMLWIISGPSSAGKSTFLASPRCAELTGLAPSSLILWPTQPIPWDALGGSDAFYHYNLLRHTARGATGFAGDAPWADLAARDIPKQAIVLAASKQTLIQRMRQRRIIEDSRITGHRETPYPVATWIESLEQADLVALYTAWRQELRDRGIPYRVVSGENSSYRVIENEAELASLVNGRRMYVSTSEHAGGNADLARAAPEDDTPSYTREQIVALLRERNFAYQRVELPFGLHTGGEDRGRTRDIVLPPSLTGKSVLDVGSALGYFCFEAEARGAARVVGVEPWPERFADALLLKEIKRSGVEFMPRDVVLDPLTETFDLVLLLNVLHHLKEPFRAVRQLAAITRERLVIEFPTLDDPKYRSTVDAALPPELARLPLVGVSSMAPHVDQTFVFSPEAIRRVLLDHEPLFARIAFHDSPVPGRMIALCDK